MPSISAGVGASYLNGNDAWKDNTNKQAMASWMVGLTWNDVFLEGNVWDMPWVSHNSSTRSKMALWLTVVTPWSCGSFQVTDNIQITPAVYWLSRPSGTTPRTSTATTSLSASRWSDPDHLQILITGSDFGWAFRTTFLSPHISSPPLRRALWPFCGQAAAWSIARHHSLDRSARPSCG